MKSFGFMAFFALRAFTCSDCYGMKMNETKLNAVFPNLLLQPNLKIRKNCLFMRRFFLARSDPAISAPALGTMESSGGINGSLMRMKDGIQLGMSVLVLLKARYVFMESGLARGGVRQNCLLCNSAFLSEHFLLIKNRRSFF